MRFLIAYLLLCANAVAQTQPPTGNFVYIDQIGSANTIYVLQTDSDAKRITMTSTGDLNQTTIIQQGTGNHTASIQNLTGNSNIINLQQTGAGKHEFNIINNPGTVNTSNTVNALQSGGVGSDKWFNIWFNGATGATVNVTQNNATVPDQASMSITCRPCGTWTYTKN
jgi:hypothetical protein